MAPRPKPGRGGREEPGARTQAREAAVQMLYALDSGAEPDADGVERCVQSYWAHLEGPAAGRAYADELVRGVMAVRDQLDAALRAANPAWRIERMARVDRSILRLGAYELLERDDVPMQVAIDEAVELAKRFGGDESRAFVNGTLDAVARARGKR